MIKLRRPPSLPTILVVAIVYFLAAKLGLAMAIVAEQVTTVWPPTGIALASLILLGRGAWPGVFIGAFLANATAHETLPVAMGIAVGNTLEAVIGSRLLVEGMGFRRSLDRLRDVFALTVLAAGFSTMVSATIGVLSLCAGGIQPWSAYGVLWAVWWLGDSMGCLIAAPLILTWSDGSIVRMRLKRVFEAGVLVLGLGVVCDVVFFSRLGSAGGHQLAYAVFPFIIWGGVRFGPKITSLLIVETSSLAVWGTIRGLGPFAEGGSHQSLILLQVFMAVVSITALVLGAAVTERNLAQRRLSVDYAVTRILATSVSLKDATRAILRTICETLDWDVGGLWTVDTEAEVLRNVEMYRMSHRPGSAFDAMSHDLAFKPGIGLPGRVWSRREPCWIPDVVTDDNFPRAAAAAEEGMHGAFGFPILVGDRVLGVMEFFSHEIRQPDPDVLTMFGNAGSKIGQFIERKETESAIRDSNALKGAILEAALDCIITIDQEGLIREFNPAAESTFGYRREEVLGRSLAECIVPERMREAHRLGLRRVVQEGQGKILGKRLEMPALRKDGEEFPVELTVQPIPTGGPPMFTAYLRDISGRKQAEESSLRLAAIVESSNDAIFSKTLDGLITSWNRGAELMYGYRESEIIGRRVQVLIPPERMGEYAEMMDRLRQGEGTPNFETERIRKGGSRIDVSLTISPLRSGSGQVLGASTIVRDISARKSDERERAELLVRERQARSEADAANRAKDEFLSTVSHELRTPLNAILGWAHLLREGRLDTPTIERACETILRNARSQQRIIEDILDLSRIVSGTVRLDMRPVDLHPIVAIAMDSVRPTAEAKGIELGTVSDAGSGRVLGDPERIQQVVWNLLSNAIKFTPDGGSVRVRLVRSGPFVEIEVSDTGKGIRADLLPYVFDRFRQGDSTSTRQHGGLGLGLAIVRHLVELQGGSVYAASPGEDQGSVFTVRLPLILAPAEGKERRREGSGAATSGAHSSGSVPILQGLKVLIVDDEEDSRAIVEEILKRNGASVASAASGREALAYVQHHPLDVLVSDIGMPEQDGYDLIRAVRALSPDSGGDIRAIALTAYARMEDRTRAIREGFQMHLSKPVDPRALVAAILAVAGRPTTS